MDQSTAEQSVDTFLILGLQNTYKPPASKSPSARRFHSP